MILLLIILNFIYPVEIYPSVAGGGATNSNRFNLDATHLITTGMLDSAGFPLGKPEWDIDPETGRELQVGTPLSIRFPFLEKIVELFLRSTNELPPATNQIIVEAITGVGNRSQRLYKASLKEHYTQKTILFLKISREGTIDLIRPTNNVQAVRKLTALQDDGLIVAKLHESQQHRPDIIMPNIILLAGLAQYTVNGSTKTIELTRAAQGVTIDNIINTASRTSSNSDLECFKRSAYLVGLTLANIQKLFLNYNNSNNPQDWDTLQHHDFHPGNIFFDASLNQISWIDNETMDISPDILFDLKTHLKNVILYFTPNQSDLETTYVTEFFKGYLEGYSTLNKKNFFEDFLLSIFHNNPKINPILENLIRQIPSSTATSQSNNNETNERILPAQRLIAPRSLAQTHANQTTEHHYNNHHSAHGNNHHYLDEEQIKDFQQLYRNDSNHEQEGDDDTSSQSDSNESWWSRFKKLIW